MPPSNDTPSNPISGEVEMALLHSEERFRLLFQHIPIPVWVEDMSGVRKSLDAMKAAGITDIRAHLTANPAKVRELTQAIRVLDLNDAVLKVHRATSREQLLNNLGLVFTESTYRNLVEEFVNFAEGRYEFDIEEDVRKLDGEPMRVISRVSVARGHEASLDLVLIFVVDITGRTRAEEHARRVSRLYRVLGEINQLIVREHDPVKLFQNACRIAVESGGLRMAWIGYLTEGQRTALPVASAGVVDGFLDRVRIDLDDPSQGCCPTGLALHSGNHVLSNDIGTDPNFAPCLEAANARGYRSAGVFPFRVAGQVGGTISFYSETCGFFDAEEVALLDKLAMDIGFALEISRREAAQRQTEAALRDSEERFRELAENIEEVFWMTDPGKNRMLYLSPGYERIWGRTVSAAIASPWTWLDAVHPDDRERVRDAVLRDQPRGTYDLTYRILRPDGRERWIRDRAFPIVDGDGVVQRIVGTAMDVTEQRRLEEQFRQSQKMEAVGQLAGGVAHDFNNILAAIMMQVQLASMSEGLPEEVRQLHDDIRGSAERAANLTRQLLAFSRRQVLQPKDLDLNEVVTSITKLLQRTVGEDIQLQLHLFSAPLQVHADAGMLDQVLLNLFVNARDAMPDGGRIVVETSPVVLREPADRMDLPAGRYVRLRVTDTGCGIAPEILPHLFEPFFTTKQPGKGTGLGLATVFGIVKQHKGGVSVDSTPGKGTTFDVLLPESQAKAEPQAEVHLAPRGGTETILVVEDEAIIRMLIRAILERAGYRVLEAASGVEALKVWERNRDVVQLLFTDIVMPDGINGRALSARLRSEKPGLPVVFTSGYSAEIAGRDLDLEQGQTFLQKPASPAHLLEVVRKTIEGAVRHP
jgi:two-component system, cell cycle sensor histidine kinase and response regulator CckA